MPLSGAFSCSIDSRSSQPNVAFRSRESLANAQREREVDISLREMNHAGTDPCPQPSAPCVRTVRYPRLIPKDEECAEELAKPTLTNLYNTRPTWLDLAHQRLDAAVAPACGWPADLSDDEILSRLLALNLDRASREK